TVVFDKTGTVTVGAPNVVRIIPAAGVSEEQVLSVAASLERHSEHPIATAVIRAAGQRSVRLQRVENVQARAGSGVTGEIGGRGAAIGNAQLMRALGVEVKQDAVDFSAAADGGSQLFVAADGQVLGKIVVADAIRHTSREAVESLKDL